MPVDQLGLVQPDVRLHERVVQGVAAVAAALNERPRKTLDWKTPTLARWGALCLVGHTVGRVGGCPTRHRVRRDAGPTLSQGWASPDQPRRL